MTSCMISLTQLRVPSYISIIQYLAYHTLNRRINVLLDNVVIDTFFDTMNGFVCIRIVGHLLFSCHGTPKFKCLFCIQSNLKFKFENVAIYIRIPFHIKTVRIC